MACSSCGLEGVSGTCSMCYGDPDHNTDGMYRRYLEEWLDRQELEQQREDAEEASVSVPESTVTDSDLPF
jgi:hypothetical protein